jgi:hypothetical protein
VPTNVSVAPQCQCSSARLFCSFSSSSAVTSPSPGGAAPPLQLGSESHLLPTPKSTQDQHLQTTPMCDYMGHTPQKSALCPPHSPLTCCKEDSLG